MTSIDDDLTVKDLTKLISERDGGAAEVLNTKYGGVSALCKKLGSDPSKGLSKSADFDAYIKRFGKNFIPPQSLKTYLELIWEACQDFTIIILSISAVIGVILAILVNEEPVDGIGILIAVLLVINITAWNDWRKQAQFAKLNAVVRDTKVIVVRDGVKSETLSSQVVVGDVMNVETGAILVADGLFINGADVTTDESALTGEPDFITKNEKKMFLLSGTKVMSGSCTFLVIAVGPNSETGRITTLVQTQEEDSQSVLQAKLEEMVVTISKAGTFVAAICFLIMLIKFCVLSYAMQDPEFTCVDFGDLHPDKCAGPNPLKDGEPYCGVGAKYVINGPIASLDECARQVQIDKNCNRWLQFDDTTKECSCSAVGICETFSSAAFTTATYSLDGCMLHTDQEKCEDHLGCTWSGSKCDNPVFPYCDPDAWDSDCSILTKIDKDSTNDQCLDFTEADYDLAIPKESRVIVKGSPCDWFDSHLSRLLTFFITAITILVVAIPEGLPLATTISLAYAVIKMQTDNNLVKHLTACETMGSATRICSDKTGTLTQNSMTAVRVYTGSTDEITDISTSIERLKLEGPKNTLQILGSSFSSFGFAEIVKNEKTGKMESLGNVTECALLKFGEALGYPHLETRATHKVACRNVFSSERKRCSVVTEKPDGGYRILVQGASEMVLDLCSQVDGNEQEPREMTDSRKGKIKTEVIQTLNGMAMRTIAIAYKDVDGSFDIKNIEESEKDLQFLAIIGIEDPIREEVPRSIRQCVTAHIDVSMVTGDNLATAVAIAKQCGILRPDIDLDAEGNPRPNAVMTGPDFRSQVLDDEDNIIFSKFDQIWPTLRVLARSSPTDKYTLVKGLNESELYKTDKGCTVSDDRQVVAVTGDGTNDAPALKRADVGFAMGIAGTSVARDAADVIVLDDNFKSIVAAAKWGRNVHDSCVKFLQFQLTVNVVACVLATIGAITINDSPLKTVQMLWVNVIMDSAGALALATEPPVDAQLTRPPYGRHSSMITNIVYWNIFGHSFFQLIILCVLLFAGPDICAALGYPIASGIGLPHNADPTIHFTMIFNTLVTMTLFNEINCRKLFHERNVFKNITKSNMFFYVEGMQILCQVLLIEIPAIGKFTKTTPLPGWAWLMCILIGSLSLPVQQIIITVANAYKSRCSKVRVSAIENEEKKQYSSKIAPLPKIE